MRFGQRLECLRGTDCIQIQNDNGLTTFRDVAFEDDRDIRLPFLSSTSDLRPTHDRNRGKKRQKSRATPTELTTTRVRWLCSLPRTHSMGEPPYT